MAWRTAASTAVIGVVILQSVDAVPKSQNVNGYDVTCMFWCFMGIIYKAYVSCMLTISHIMHTL